MKALAVIVALLCFALPAVSQDKKYIYCELTPDYKFVSGKLVVYIDFGDRRGNTDRKGNSQRNLMEIKDEKTGAPIEFISVIEAINYMADKGWELVQVYVVQVAGTYSTHYIMKKPIEDSN